MKIIIPGGTGQVGALLARAFVRDGHETVILSRRADPPVPAGARVAPWDARTLGAWTAELEGADAVINLAGRSVNCRYHPANRREIIQSRVESTRAVGRALRRAVRPPRVWLQASTATIYAHRFLDANDEVSGLLGGHEETLPDTWRFSYDVCRAWESAAEEFADLPATRQVLLRSAITMSPDRGGAFDVLLGLVRCGLGGREGDGRQFVSWIHEADFVRAAYWLMSHDTLTGPVNLAAPQPLPNAEFLRALRAAWGIPFGLPAARWMLELGALLLRTETELILKSRRVVPGRLLASGFAFEQPAWPEAARELCARWRAGRAGG